MQFSIVDAASVEAALYAYNFGSVNHYLAVITQRLAKKTNKLGLAL